jgi:hypothetical protein
MSANDLSRFEDLIKEHRSAWHPLFSHVEAAAQAGCLAPDAYALFAVNIAARTMLSLPEIHACCIQAALDLDPLRTAYSVMTGAEEGGFGKPRKVHTVLMMDALNHHGRVVFGLPEVHLGYLMALVRLAHASRQYRCFLEIENSVAANIREQLRDGGLWDAAEILHICRRMAAQAGLLLPEESARRVELFIRLEREAIDRLTKEKVLPETIDYCLAQLDVLNKTRAGYLQGVGFAHEGLADGMIYKMFRILYCQIDRYQSRDDFLKQVYPYFSAHGNYMDVFHGEAENTDGVEVIHAQRELAKLNSLDHEALEAAWKGANEFADRNVRIWDGLLNALKESSPPVLPAVLSRDLQPCRAN